VTIQPCTSKSIILCFENIFPCRCKLNLTDLTRDSRLPDLLKQIDSSVKDSMEGYTYKQAMCDTFLQAVEQEEFKNGAFRGHITRDTSFEDAVDTFINSSAVTDAEKEQYFRPMRSLMATMDERERTNPNYPNKMRDAFKILDLCVVFEMDRQSRYSGGDEFYDAPMLLQTMQPGLNITKTYTIDNNGNKKSFEGGQYGVNPDAPEWYKRMNTGRTKPLFDGMQEDETKSPGKDGGSSISTDPTNSVKEENAVTAQPGKGTDSLRLPFSCSY